MDLTFGNFFMAIPKRIVWVRIDLFSIIKIKSAAPWALMQKH